MNFAGFSSMPDLLTISEVSRRSGVAASALRFYEERHLIESERAGSGHRRYPRAALRRIAFIVFAQRMGLTLQEVAVELAKLPENRVPNGLIGPSFLRAGLSVLMSASQN
jgi:MerR family redox-sensitive transcriptional activator SoxR